MYLGICFYLDTISIPRPGSGVNTQGWRERSEPVSGPMVSMVSVCFFLVNVYLFTV
jgi:hypothetical protein